MRDWFNRWILAYLLAVWEFFAAEDIDLNTDWAPDFSHVRRSFTVYVLDRTGRVKFRAPVVDSYMNKEEIELLFIDGGYRPSDIIVSEVLT